MKFIKDVFKTIDWLNLVMYCLFGFLLAFGGIGALTQPWVFFPLLAILIFVDIRSHNLGLDKGVEIMKDVWSK